MRTIFTTVLFCVSLNTYATCVNHKPEEMLYYAYMDKEELNSNYCLCRSNSIFYKEQAKKSRANGITESYYKNAERAENSSHEMKKMELVLKKDYGVEPEDCDKK